MNERTNRDRFHALGPLVLRLGIAVVLAQQGLQHTAALFHAATPSSVQTGAATLIPASAAATMEGLRISADWGTVFGVGELVVAGLLLIGLLTRLVILAPLVVLGYGIFVGFPHASLAASSSAMWLLAVACLSLFVSGGGSLSLRRRRRAPAVATQPQQPQAQPAQPAGFVRQRMPLTQRIGNWLSQRCVARQPARRAMTPQARRWPWQRRKLEW